MICPLQDRPEELTKVRQEPSGREHTFPELSYCSDKGVIHIHVDNTQWCGCKCYSRPLQSSSPSSWGMAAQPFKGWPALRSRTGNPREIWHQNKELPSFREPGLKQTLLSIFSKPLPIIFLGAVHPLTGVQATAKLQRDLFRGKGSK